MRHLLGVREEPAEPARLREGILPQRENPLFASEERVSAPNSSLPPCLWRPHPRLFSERHLGCPSQVAGPGGCRATPDAVLILAGMREGRGFHPHGAGTAPGSAVQLPNCKIRLHKSVSSSGPLCVHTAQLPLIAYTSTRYIDHDDTKLRQPGDAEVLPRRQGTSKSGLGWRGKDCRQETRHAGLRSLAL